jgi:glycolate oxidase FAD binding subunit
VEIEAALQARGQMLGFEPPRYGVQATLGGCVAAGLSGPRRAACGSVRDFVLGVRVIDGRGDHLRFGGQVMKNVAGYDVSRLMTGALGTLGILTEISLKVLPLPKAEMSLGFEMDEAAALAAMNRWAGQPLPISASCHVDGVLTLRLSGAESAVRAAREKLGGQVVGEGAGFWASLREQQTDFFRQPGCLWRLSLPATARTDRLGSMLIEWGGAQRWLKGGEATTVRAAAESAGGHATLFKGNDGRCPAFHPVAPALLAIHQRLKREFDPAGILNPGRMYPEF